MAQHRYTFYEFFAGGGMARAGLGKSWKCLFANDFDLKKSQSYAANWGWAEFLTEDVRKVTVSDLPGAADLVWGSFPCQDLSLAGGGAGLRGERSGTYWPFWRLMESLIADKRQPAVIVVENVCGTITSHGGKDFAAICENFHKAGYRFGPLVIDAAQFLPQSRPRLFVVAVRNDIPLPARLCSPSPGRLWHPRSLIIAKEKLGSGIQASWLWWNLSPPVGLVPSLADLIESTPSGVTWHSELETRKLIEMMSPLNRRKVQAAMQRKRLAVGTLYKRTRPDETGSKVQRAEVRFDNIAGCLRTPAGGSSRQTILVIEGDRVRSRLISTRETARLMGLPDDYLLPKNYNEGYHLTGDGVVVPVVRYIAAQILEPILNSLKRGLKAA